MDPDSSNSEFAEGVSRDLARSRSILISDTRYVLDLELRPEASRMPGHITIHFDLSASVDPLVLDFRDLDSHGASTNGSARNLKVNGSPEPLAQSAGHVVIPGNLLHPGPNTIALDFDSAIAESNRPITRFTDATDGAEYLYSLFVPMDASLAFPCFDQPDLKARFTLTITAPSDWTVISNSERARCTQNGDTTRTTFDETDPISTYLFAFAAGPFEMLEHSGLRLFVCRSATARAEQEWPAMAEITRIGIDLMSAWFDYPFPFSKYDQVLIPGFPYGGMEHAGATFLNEDAILFRTIPTISDHNRRRELVLHELAHQWFGDLVTMRWFDDLWLKEGFAQYMAYRAIAQMEPASTVWKRFYQSIKPLAYAIDSTRGTTPIYQDIPNLKDAKSAYGAIVYQKAPSLLRLLAFSIGEDHFREGVRLFLRRHAWSNATWSDLIAAFSQASGQGLDSWAKAWITQRGMPQVRVSWTCGAQSRIAGFRITQQDTVGAGNTWPIRTQILLGHRNAPPDRIVASFHTASATIPEAIGKSCPDYVFANDEDHAYGEFLLDPQSRVAITGELPNITDPFQRALLWGALWDSVRNLEMPPLEYAELALNLLPSETDPELAVSLLGRLRIVATIYLPDNQQSAIASRFESLLIQNLTEAPIPDLRITSFRALTLIATTPHARDTLNDLLNARMTIPGVTLHQRDRWNIIGALIAAGDPDAPALLAAESTRDTSDDGRKYAWLSGSGFRNSENKKKYFAEYLENPNLKEDWITASLPLFNHWTQTAITLPFLQPALEVLPQLKRERKIFFVMRWLSSFVCGQNSLEALRAIDGFLSRDTCDPDLRLKILEVRDELARTIEILAQ